MRVFLIAVCCLFLLEGYAETPPGVPPTPPGNLEPMTVTDYILLALGAIFLIFIFRRISKKDSIIHGYKKNEKGTWRTHSYNWKEEENK